MGKDSGEEIKNENFEATMEYYENDDFESAYPLFEKAFAEGYAEAGYRLGFMHYVGEYVEEDEEKARRYFSESAKCGCHLSVNSMDLLWGDDDKLRKMLEDGTIDLIIDNDRTERAAALSYYVRRTSEKAAPMVVAYGMAERREMMLETAKERNITVASHRILERCLMMAASVGEEIPEEFYQAVAEEYANGVKAKEKS